MARNRTRTALRPTLISLAVASCFSTSAALANPTGANVVHGTAAIHQAGNLLQITNSPNAIINWQSFSIGASEITRFIQQSPASAVLNRVTSQSPSSILGALQSNGRVFLINPNGILIGAGAQIDVAGLVASTLALSDQDFLAGRLRFTDGLGKSVVNDGSISTGAGGSVYLIGSGVANNGVITSPSGEVVLAAGNSVELVSPGTPNLRVEVAASDHEARNLGQIISDAGRIGIYAGLINNSGTIRADSAVAEGGRILLKATKNATLESGSTTTANGTSGGSVTVQSGDTTLVSGTVEATGSEGKGGTVQVLGNLVGVIDNASLNASGETGGGTVLVGGDFQGKPALSAVEGNSIQNAFRTYVGPDVTITADAITSGDGGKVIVWSDDATRAYGTISARGGTQSGNGGFVEVSGRKWLDFRANVSTAAPNGTTGTLLLDPADVEIIEATLDLGQGCFGCGIGDILTSPGNSIFGAGLVISEITWGTIKNVLTQNNAIITTDGTSQTGLGNITVSDPSGDLSTSRNLQLIAHNNIIVNGKIENSFGDGQSNPTVALFAGWDGVSDPANPVITSGTGQIFLNAPISMTGVGGQVFLIAGNGITQAMTGPVTASGLLANGGAGNVDMQAANMVGTLAGRISVPSTASTSRFFRFNNAQSLDIGTVAQVSGVDVSITPRVLQSYNVDIQISTTTGDLNVKQPVNSGFQIAIQCVAGSDCPRFTESINLTAAQDLNVTNGIGGSVITLAAARDINVADLNQLETGIGAIGEAVLPATASVAFSAGRDVSITNSGIFASSSLAGGTASISMTAGTAGTGAISVSNNSTLQATVGSNGFGSGGSSTVTLNAANGITISDSSILAGNSGSLFFASPGSATVSLNGNSGPVAISNSTISAVAGPAENNSGFDALVSVSGNGITVNGSTVEARGGFGSGDGAGPAGSATISLNGNSGLLQLNSSSVQATGGSGALVSGGQGLVSLTGGSISVSGSTVAATGGSGFSGGAGGNASLSLNTGGSITVAGSIGALGGGGSGESASGGSATVVLTGNSIDVSGLVVAQGGFGSANGGTGSVALNAGVGGITVQSSGGLICEFGCEVILSDVKTTAVSRVVGLGVSAIGGGGGNTGGAATAVLNTTGNIAVDNSFVFAEGGGAQGTGGNANVLLTTGGNITLASNVVANGGLGSIGNGAGRIDLIFSSSSGIFSVNGQTDLIFDNLTGSGFMVDNLPAILNTNLFVTKGAPAFFDILVATMNQQIDVLADQLKAGETGQDEDEKEKLPFCGA